MKDTAKIRKGNKILFRTDNQREETVMRGSSNPVMGMILTDKQEYSFDFIRRWERFGFLTILDK